MAASQGAVARRPPLLSVAIAALLIATPTIAHAYRTLSDTVEFADAAPNSVTWSTDAIRYSIVDDLPNNLSRAAVQAAIVRQFGTWEEVPCANVTTSNDGFTSTPAVLGDGVSTISWVRTGWALGATAGAHTDLVTQKTQDGQWVIVEADVQLNAENFDWTVDATPTGSAKELNAILLHELGHFLGLTHPCAPEAAICADGCESDAALPSCTAADDDIVMNPVYDTRRVMLSDDDRAGLCALYPRKDCTAKTPCPNGAECSDGICATACGKTVCGLGEVCIDSACMSACQRNTDCDVGQTCDARGACVSGRTPFSAACIEDADCSLGVCSAGTCLTACSEEVPCSGGGACLPPVSDDSWGACAEHRLPLGAKCAEAEDCLSGECLTRSPGDDVCSRPCGEGELACPADWECRQVSGKSVCAPLALAAAGGGCTLGPPKPTREGTTILMITILGSLLPIRARRRRRGNPRISPSPTDIAKLHRMPRSTLTEPMP